MITIALITFRETMEMFFIGLALYTSLVEHKIQKKRDLFMGAGLGLIFSVALFILVSFAGSQVHIKIDPELAEIGEGISYLISGIFLFFTVIILHNKMKHIVSLSPQFLLSTSIFSIGFLTIFREGIEIIFFSISPSISSSFVTSLLGFIMGIFGTMLVGFISVKFLSKAVPQRLIMQVTEWSIKILSVYFVVKGVAELSEFIIK